jgi:tetratricopeptide (TPR) repeat protein
MDEVKSGFKAVQFKFNGGRKTMKQHGSPRVVTLLVAVSLLAGCHGDPNVRKLKYLNSGKQYAAEGKYREAAIQFSNAVKIDKEFADAHYELGQTYVHLGEFNAAYGELQRTVDLQPANYKARLDLASILLGGGKVDAAETQTNSVMAVQPENPDVYAMLSAIAHKRGENDKALAEIRHALQLDPNRAVFHEDLALLESGDPANSSSVEEELGKSAALDPKSANAKLLLASFYSKNKRWSEAEQAARDAVAIDPKSIPARQALAQIFLKQDNQAKAEEVLRQASQDLSDDPKGVEILANYYADSGQTGKAISESARLSSKYPKNASVQQGYLRALLEAKDYATAQKVAGGLSRANSSCPETAGLKGILLLNNGKADEAVDVLIEATNNYPKDAFLQYWLGKAALAKGDNDLAESSFRKAVAINPFRLDAEGELARIASQRGDTDLLADVANKTIAAAPGYPGGYVWRAATELSHNSEDKAEADLKTAVSVAPQSPQVYLEFGKLRFVQKRFPEGVVLLEKALQYDPDSVEAVRLLVGYDLYQKQPAEALARVNAQIAKSPKNSGFYDLLARLQSQSKNLDQAAATAQKAIQLNPNDGEAVVLLVQIQVQRGQNASAAKSWEQWSNAHPADATAFAILGTLEESLGDQSKAEVYYRKSLQIQPKSPIAANNLAYLMLQHGENVDVAMTLAQTARQGMPNSANTADTLAWAYYNKGIYAFARDLLEEAIKTDPENATMQYHLGMVYGKLSDRTSATVHLKKAVSLARDSSIAKDAQAALQGLG